MNHTITCPICESLASPAFRTSNGDVLRCRSKNCGHFFAGDRNQERGVCDYSATPQDFQPEFVIRNNLLIDWALSKSIVSQESSVLDLGSGTGHVAACFRDRGFSVACVEPSDAARQVLESRGLKNIPYAKDIPEGEMYDFIYSIEVVEHMPSPVQTLKEVALHLSKAGTLFLTTPSALSLMAKISRTRNNSFGVASHLHYFTPSSLTRCLHFAGLREINRCYLPFMVPDRSLLTRTIARCLHVAGLGGGIAILARSS